MQCCINNNASLGEFALQPLCSLVMLADVQAAALRAYKGGWRWTCRKEGRIRAYGMATWDSFRRSQDDPRHVSLQEMVNIARTEGGINHGFRCAPPARCDCWKP